MLNATTVLALGAATCLGLGLGVAKLFLREADRGMNFGDAGLLGLASLAVVGTAANMITPLAPWPAMATSAIGVVLLVIHRGRLKRLCAAEWSSAATPVLLLAAFFLAFLPSILRSTAWHFDAGLYHLQHVRQAMELPVVLGLANVHERFGYNTVWLPAAAIMTGGPHGIAGAFVINALLAGFLLLAVTERVFAAVRAGHARPAVFGTLVILLVFFTPTFTLRGWIGSPNTDIPATLLALYAFQLALEESDAAENRFAIAWLLTVCVVLAVAVKLSALPLVLLLLLPLLDWWRRRLSGSQVAALAGAALAVGVPWVLRGLATSGCLAYPQPASCLRLPWVIDGEIARGDMDWMRAWARLPGIPPEIVLADRAWLRPWAEAALTDPGAPYAAGVLALVLVLAALPTAAGPRFGSIWAGLNAARRVDSLLILGVALAALVFWFVTAPLIRYGKTFVFLPLLLAVAFLTPAAAVTWVATWVPGVAVRWRLGVLMLSALVLYSAVRPARVLPFGPLDFPLVPQVETRAIRDFGGLRITQPLEGQQCWDAPRLCTPRLHRDITAYTHGAWWVVRSRSDRDDHR